MTNIYASCVSWQNKGILFLGKSQMGKSDLCLRLIQDFDSVLVADDRVDLNVSHETIFASSPRNLRGLLEVRGVGILKLPYNNKCKIDLVVELVSQSDVERMPNDCFWSYEDIKIPLLRLYAFEASTPNKIIAALNWSKV